MNKVLLPSSGSNSTLFHTEVQLVWDLMTTLIKKKNDHGWQVCHGVFTIITLGTSMQKTIIHTGKIAILTSQTSSKVAKSRPCPSADCIAERCNSPYIFWNRLVCFRADRISLKIMGCRLLCANWRHVPGISLKNLQEQIRPGHREMKATCISPIRRHVLFFSCAFLC